MAHEILKIANSVFNKPQLINPEHFKNLINYVIDRNNGDVIINTDKKEKKLWFDDDDDDDNELIQQNELQYLGIDPETMIGQLDVQGTLIYKQVACESLCGLTSYQRLENTFKSQVEAGINTVVLYVDSGGGEAYGCFETAQNIRNIADENNIKVLTYIDGVAFSGGYAWASIADEVILNPSGQVGSIGVVVQLINDSKFLEKNGLDRIFVYAGDNKIPFDDDGKFSESFLQRIQKSVDKTYIQFVDFVSKNMNISVESVKETNADIFDADEALSIGLVNKLMTREDFFNDYLLEFSQNNNQLNNEQDGEIILAENNNEDQKQDLQSQDKKSVVTENLEMENLKKQLQESNKQIQELKNHIANEKQQAIMKDREIKLSNVLDDETVKTVLEGTSGLTDEAFAKVLAGFSKVHVEKEQEMKELGSKGDDTDHATTFDEQLVKHIESKQK